MEAASASVSLAGPSTEAATTAAYEDDARHFAITASQVPKPTASMSPPPLPGPAAEMSGKDVKSSGTRFHEDCYETDGPAPRLRSSRAFKGKGKDAVVVEKEKKKPLCLLDLPVDILKDIVKEVTHTNDLTSLALCHSALHRLTIPHIYSRFDIVWPDNNTHAEPRSGVDALTYGLATLVMAEEIFGEAPGQHLEHRNRYTTVGYGKATETTVRRRRGNHYAQFTRKFSLGNGPADWVQEYLITKEGGKMLGTLVALAVARMRTLETFVWDMPTGILRDVWLALSSLDDRGDNRPCRLEKLWIRWHDNSSADTTNPIPPPPPPPINLTAISPPSLQTAGSHMPGAHGLSQVPIAALDRVEHPTFSVLPPLKSLSVLDIDELAYLDEMAVLIGRSLDKLRELRVGIAQHALMRDWPTVWEGDGLQQVDPDNPTAGSLTIGEKRLGGVLGTLTGFVCDMRRPKVVLPDRTKRRSHSDVVTPAKAPAARGGTPEGIRSQSTIVPEPFIFASTDAPIAEGITSLRDVLPDYSSDHTLLDSLADNSGAIDTLAPPEETPLPESLLDSDPLVAISRQASPEPAATLQPLAPENPVFANKDVLESLELFEPEPVYLNNTLRLENLELERVPLSVPVIQKALDWTLLTSLTLLHCQNHEQLWKTLRRTFSPRPKSPLYPQARRSSNTTPKKIGKASYSTGDMELDYQLNLKKVHTNTVSPSLISFLKETLRPNSLEVMFLQETRSYSSSVAVDTIFRGPLRRHRNSLRKILIDSSEKGTDGLPANSSRWRRWMLNREVLGFICSGKMPSLRELGMAIDYRDWHFFLQHLPIIPHLRSLYIPFLADHVHGTNVDPRELALQVVDIVALRPEVELCYMGIANKCFEILESRRNSDADLRPESRLGLSGHAAEDGAGSDAGEEEEEEEDEDDGADDDDDGHDGVEAVTDDTESNDDDDDGGEDDDDDETDSDAGSEGGKGAARLRLREILFYDDKVAIFKARHGRL